MFKLCHRRNYGPYKVSCKASCQCWELFVPINVKYCNNIQCRPGQVAEICVSPGSQFNDGIPQLRKKSILNGKKIFLNE